MKRKSRSDSPKRHKKLRTEPLIPKAMSTRAPTHAGSWYTSNGKQLASKLDTWLEAVGDKVEGIGEHSKGQKANVPVRGARVIIAPHAGYSYSGPAAAYAYKALDLTNVKRIFLLGPSHHFYLTKCALSQCKSYGTPIGDIPLDAATIAALAATKQFDKMALDTDEDEHSLEMHLPYLRHLLNKLPSGATQPLLVPILVGNTSAASEQAYGKLLAPYFADPANAFVVSSDFAHWGLRFRYTFYQPTPGAAGRSTAKDLRSGDSIKGGAIPIHESIAHIDHECMAVCETGDHAAWTDILKETSNTVCGRHPIGVILAALEQVEREGKGSGVDGKVGRFRFVRYERSSDVVSVGDSSVSYCSAYCVV